MSNANPSGDWRPGALRKVRKHKDEDSPVALYQFDRSLANSSGAAPTLTVGSGTASYTEAFPDFQMIWFDTALGLTASSAALRLLGASTWQALVMFDAGTNGNPFMQIGNAGDLEADNVLYEGKFTTRRDPIWFSEHGAGIDDTVTLSTFGAPPVHTLFHWTQTRAVDGTITWYINGVQYGTPQAVTPATGGTTTTFRLSVNTVGTFCAHMFLASLRIYGSLRTAAQIAADYNYCLGEWYGYREAA